MPGPHYSPFDKEIRDLSVADLVALRSVPEGWYIEYKRSLPNTKSIAKSISAFANTYGGWLFYGVKEAASGDRTAGEFSGIPVADAPAAEVRIRQSASSSISASPYFETRVLHGPCDELGLVSGMAIIVVTVQMSPDAPHVHCDGRIYRRVADASDPRPETDRHFLDLLWQRGDRRRRRLKELIEGTPLTSEAEEEASYLEVFLLPSPWGERVPRHDIAFDEFVELMESGDRETGGLPFDNIFSSSQGFIARQAKGNQLERLNLSWRYYGNGTSHITFPFSSRSFDPRDAVTFAFFNGYTEAEAFFRECSARNMTNAVIVDLNWAFALLWGIMRRHETLAIKAQIDFPWDMKLRIRGVWRRVPFLDTTTYGDFIAPHGIPIVQTKEASWPPGSSFHSLQSQAEGQEAEVWTAMKSSMAFACLCQMFGLPVTKMVSGDNWYVDLLGLIERARIVQQMRNALERH